MAEITEKNEFSVLWPELGLGQSPSTKSHQFVQTLLKNLQKKFVDS